MVVIVLFALSLVDHNLFAGEEEKQEQTITWNVLLFYCGIIIEGIWFSKHAITSYSGNAQTQHTFISMMIIRHYSLLCGCGFG